MRPSIPKASSKSLKLALSNWGFSWSGIRDNRKGEWWLIGQVLLITAHLLPAFPPLTTFGVALPAWLILLGPCLLLIGIFKSVKAFVSLGANLSPLPSPKPGSQLVRDGSYKSCRHPLYQGILISSLGVMISLGSIFHAFLFICLTALLIGKAKKEELLLSNKHLDYIKYLEDTPAIMEGIPFLDWRA